MPTVTAAAAAAAGGTRRQQRGQRLPPRQDAPRQAPAPPRTPHRSHCAPRYFLRHSRPRQPCQMHRRRRRACVTSAQSGDGHGPQPVRREKTDDRFGESAGRSRRDRQPAARRWRSNGCEGGGARRAVFTGAVSGRGGGGRRNRGGGARSRRKGGRRRRRTRAAADAAGGGSGLRRVEGEGAGVHGEQDQGGRRSCFFVRSRGGRRFRCGAVVRHCHTA